MIQKLRKIRLFWTLGLVIGAFGLFLLDACKPISDFQKPLNYKTSSTCLPNYPQPNRDLKTVIIIADNNGTEIFDLLAPFYLFSQTKKANVYILAKKPEPIPLFRGLLILPQHTFQSFRSLNIKPDLIVIPNLSTIKKEEIDGEIITFIKSQYFQGSSRVLSVCDGAATAALSGIYNKAKITTHSGDISKLSEQFPELNWVENKQVTQSNRLFSTAGVANATEGSLIVISDMFGSKMAKRLAQQIDYDYPLDDLSHITEDFNFSDKLQILKKVILTKNKELGFLLYNNISEFHLAALLDTYSRTFPRSINTFSENGNPVRSLNGLIFIPTNSTFEFDEIHHLGDNGKRSMQFESNAEVILHKSKGNYIFDYILSKVENEYGTKFRKTTEKLLDYGNHQD